MTIPLSATSVRVISNASLFSDYKHTRWFQNYTQQLSYFNGKTKLYEADDMNVIVENGNEYVLRVPRSIEHLVNASYVFFKNQTKWYFCFIIKKEYEQKNVTKLYLKLDVIQTYMFDITFKTSYVEREHTQQWNGSNPVINTIDEGLNYGTDYELTSAQKIDITNGLRWLVVVSKQAIHEDNVTLEPINKIVPSIIGGVSQALSYYVVPFKSNGEGVPISNLGIPIDNPADVLEAMYTYTNAVNNIVSIYVTEHCGLSYDYNGSTVDIFNSYPDSVDVGRIRNYDSSGSVSTLYVKKLLTFDTKSYLLSNVFYGFKTVSESKLLMSPYTKMVLTDMCGNYFELKPEYFATYTPYLVLKGSLGVTNKISYSFDQYNTTLTGSPNSLVSDSNGIINVDSNDLPIVTDMLSAYMQGNRNSISNAKQQATFNATMAGVTAVTGAVGSAINKNPVGVVESIASGIQNAGNSLYEIQGINAKIKDIDNTPPNLSTQGSNLYYTFGNYQAGVFLLKYQIKNEYINVLTNFFKMFGYKVNSVKVPNLRTRQNYNYVKTIECNVFGNFDSLSLTEIRQIFNNGITLWHNDDIGNYNLPNGVI